MRRLIEALESSMGNPDQLKIVMPVCAHPPEGIISNESRILDNYEYLRSFFPKNDFLVIDNGHKPIQRIPDGMEYIYSPDLFRKFKSLGESLLIQRALGQLEVTDVVLKVHGRCKIKNMNSLIQFYTKQGQFFLIYKRMLSKNSVGIKAGPSFESRIYAADVKTLNELIEQNIVELTERRLPYIEYSMYSCIMRNPKAMSQTYFRATFCPVFSGQAGFGADYDSLRYKVRQSIRRVTYRLGL